MSSKINETLYKYKFIINITTYCTKYNSRTNVNFIIYKTFIQVKLELSFHITIINTIF